MKKNFCYAFLAVLILGSCFFFYNVTTTAEIQAAPLGTPFCFVGNDVDGNGVIWAGDKSFTLWKSTDNGATFRSVYRIPGTLDTSSPFSGLVWNVFVDSRGYIFVSAGGTNALYRSTNGGTSFSQVLNTNGTRNESFYISMTEDNQGSLYAVTYTNGYAVPIVLKSSNGGASWVKIGDFNVVHFHNIRFNPSNGYLYVVTGEPHPVINFPDAARIYRSKDYGATWSILVDRNDALGTVYLGMAFVGNYVYVGQDYPNRVCQIHRFLDDGRTGTVTPQVVYTPPGDGCMPFMSGLLFNDNLVFGNCAESTDGVTRTVASADGLNWKVIAALNIGPSDNRWNMFTVHPRSGIVFATLTTNYPYIIKDGPPLTPTPSPTPTPPPTPLLTPPPTATPSPTSQPTHPAPTATPTPTQTPPPPQNPPPPTTPPPPPPPTPPPHGDPERKNCGILMKTWKK
ncbi:MAG: WD40/YVTN/BNR-like repeat-containing protein, partial [Candidatus Bathyarchaeia archaeon]